MRIIVPRRLGSMVSLAFSNPTIFCYPFYSPSSFAVFTDLALSSGSLSGRVAVTHLGRSYLNLIEADVETEGDQKSYGEALIQGK